MTGALPASENAALLEAAGFEEVRVELKEDSRAYIANWVPGSGAEDHVCSASITATKPLSAAAAAAASSTVQKKPVVVAAQADG